MSLNMNAVTQLKMAAKTDSMLVKQTRQNCTSLESLLRRANIRDRNFRRANTKYEKSKSSLAIAGSLAAGTSSSMPQ